MNNIVMHSNGDVSIRYKDCVRTETASVYLSIQMEMLGKLEEMVSILESIDENTSQCRNIR